jgi:hypothetical protein
MAERVKMTYCTDYQGKPKSEAIGPFPHSKLGRDLLFSRNDVLDWMDRRAELEKRLQQYRVEHPRPKKRARKLVKK